MDEATLKLLDVFANALGLAFQVRDDILDVESSSEQLGKTAGKDSAQSKSTYPALLGMDGAKARLAELDLALEQHELVKVRISAEDRDARDAVVATLAERSGAHLVQRIGNVASLYRRNAEAPQIPLPR